MVNFNEKKIIELRNLVEGADLSLQQARQILDQLAGGEENYSLANKARAEGNVTMSQEGKVIEGIFDGQNMVGPDAKKYSIPANYASKSKLVEGDGLKLTITPDGSFVYKQINPLERDRIGGSLVLDEETGDYRVLANNKSYKILTASVTYFKGELGDNVALLVPKGRESTWAAVENIFRLGEGEVQPNDQAVQQNDELEMTEKEPESVLSDEQDDDQEKKWEPFVASTPVKEEVLPVEDKIGDDQGEFLVPDNNISSSSLNDNSNDIGNMSNSGSGQGLEEI